MIRRPPRSTRTDTRFPYTTLFRSILSQERVTNVHLPVSRLRAHAAATELLPGCSDVEDRASTTERRVRHTWRLLLGIDDLGLDDDFFTAGGDRKSTRLNSSH